jgi:biotin carboxyl carrier protein
VAIMQQEETVYRNRRDALQQAESAMRYEQSLIRKELVQLDERAAMQREAVDLAGQTLAANEDLVAQGFVSRQRVLELKRAHVAEESGLGALEGDRLRADQRLADLSRRVAELRNRFQESVAQELKASDERLHQLEQSVSAQQSEVQRDSITAPIAGTVINMRALSVGTAVGPLQTVMELVPTDDSMFIEAPVEPRMLDDIKKTLWAAADKLRANMDAAEYKHLVLGLIFVKYISDTFDGAARRADRPLRRPGRRVLPARRRTPDHCWPPSWKTATTTPRSTSSGCPKPPAGRPCAPQPSSPTLASASTTR